MTFNICIGENANGRVDLTMSPELSNYPSEIYPHIIVKDLPKDMVGEMIQKYIDKGGVV